MKGEVKSMVEEQFITSLAKNNLHIPTGPASSQSSAWALSTAFLCLFVLWLNYRRMRKTRTSRFHALLGEQKRLNDCQIALSAQRQEANEQKQALLSELDRLYREQSLAAVTDAVTGLPNHRAVMSRLDEALSRCQRAPGSCAVLFVDLDHFKQVNYTHGHRAGDAILREVGSRLRNGIRLEDFVGRYGSEEFAIILADTDLLGASQVADRLLAAINSQPCYWETGDTPSLIAITITGSIGVSVYQLHGTTREELIESADHAMYKAKTSGRNRVSIADVEILPSPDDAHHERWDGTGYPMKLAGEAIPLHARILTVVDSFDAMTSHRVYHEPMSIEAAGAELQRCSGSQFDPAVVEAFLRVLDEPPAGNPVGPQFIPSPTPPSSLTPASMSLPARKEEEEKEVAYGF
jgi:diguanylate cyclase (GGDEF)-like protein